MKPGSAFLISGLILLCIGFAWLILGWPAVPAGPAGIPASPSDLVPNLSAIPGFSPGEPAGNGSVGPRETGTPAPAATATTAALETPKPTADDIKLHFLDLAFGSGNAYLERWDAAENNGRIIVSLTANRDTDLQLLGNAIQQFNSVSQTNQISSQIKQGSPTGDIMVKFIPENGMNGIALNATDGLTTKEFTAGGITTAKVSRGVIYLNSDLKGDVRNHTLLRAFFYQLGCIGDTDSYPDSLFYSGENTNANLSSIDLKAIETMYGSGLTRGMTANEVRNVLYVR